jgi:hypothetical protein
MLHAAPATDAEMMAFRRYPRKCRLENLIDLGKLEAGFSAIGVIGDNLSRQGTLDENDLAFSVCNAPAFLIQGFDKNRSSRIYTGRFEIGNGVRRMNILPTG